MPHVVGSEPALLCLQAGELLLHPGPDLPHPPDQPVDPGPRPPAGPQVRQELCWPHCWALLAPDGRVEGGGEAGEVGEAALGEDEEVDGEGGEGGGEEFTQHSEVVVPSPAGQHNPSPAGLQLGLPLCHHPQPG